MQRKTSRFGAIGYVRVSTEHQRDQGIGLEAQRVGIQAYAARRKIEIINWFEEAATGRGDDNLNARPQLRQALHLAQTSGRTILIYSFDRLTRHRESARHIFQSYHVKVFSVSEGRWLDLAVAESLIARAEYEGNQIARRTSQALADLKARGVKLGNPRLAEARKLAAEAISQAKAAKVREIAEAIRQNGWHDLTRRELAGALNSIGLYTRRNKPWTLETVRETLRCARELLREDGVEGLGEHPLYGRF